MRAAFLLPVLLLCACRGGCARTPGERPRSEPRLAFLPAETRIVASVDLAKIRATAFWQRLAALAEENPQDKKTIAELTARTGLDPLKQVHRILAGFPDDARARGEFALLIEGEGFDEKRLVAYARDQASLRGQKIDERRHAGRTLWAGTAADRVTGFFLGEKSFALGAAGWGERMAELAGGAAPSAAGDTEIARLCRRIDPARALWLAALVPADVRKALLADPKYDAAASVTRLAASADLGPGLEAELVADLSNAEDARILVERLQSTVREAKRNAKVLMMGLGPYLDALTARAAGPSVHLTLSLPEAQVTDLLGRLSALTRMARERPKR